MEGIKIMPRSAKERTHERKRKRKAVSATKTDKSRTRRLANKAKRDEIHAIDPDIKVKVIDQVTYDDLGTEIMVENGKIKTVEIFEPDPEEFKKGRAIDNQIEKERLSVFNPFKWRKK